ALTNRVICSRLAVSAKSPRMHSSKAHISSAPLAREHNYDAFSYRSACILLAAIANGSAWWLLSLFVCSFFEALAGSILPLAVGLVSGCVSFIVLLAHRSRSGEV